MPEALENRNNSSQPNFEIKRRDEREEAVRVSKRISETKIGEDNRQRTVKNTERRDEIRGTAEQEKRDALDKARLEQANETLDKRRAQDKANPDSGNIINVVA